MQTDNSDNYKNKVKNTNNAQKVHHKRISKLKANKSRSSNNQGFRVDKIINDLTLKYPTIKVEDINTFKDFPLSQYTQKGLDEGGFTVPTDIQRQSIGLALQGHDILGAAKTGSGKTLAFLVPVLELLYRNKVGFLDGMSALIVSPTRELAYQTYSVLKKVGQFHDFSAGLIIGGKDLKEEKDRISRTHIVICTPGRLQQHMEQTWGFDADNLQVLVLDECDRILDMGFADTMNAILEYLPAERQTLMFSATQTKSVKDLARVGLKSPHYVSVHERAEHSTPATLEQSYMVCKLEDKINTLWFFIKNHLKSKILVFVQTAKQVRYIYESFQRLRPGSTLLSLYGTMKQIKRVKTYEEFCRKQNVVLFATDVAARGLDFPGVDWVVQFDAPENADTYIHRVGRTARYDSEGESLIFLLPSEKQEMLRILAERKIPIEEIRVNPQKLGTIQKKLEYQLVADPSLKEFAKACFIAYVKGYFLMSNKALFDLKKLNLELYAQSLGLVLAPRIRFLQKQEKIQKEREMKQQQAAAKLKSQNKEDAGSSDESDSEASQSDDSSEGEGQSKMVSDRRVQSKVHLDSASESDEETDAAGGLLTVKAVTTEQPKPDELTLQQELELKSKLKSRAISKRDLAVAMKKKGIKAKHTKFNENESSAEESFDEEEENVLDLQAARLRLQQQDTLDKEADRARVKRKHQERRWKANEERRAAKRVKTDEDEVEVVLGPNSDDNDSNQSDAEDQQHSQSESSENEGSQSDTSEADDSEHSRDSEDESDSKCASHDLQDDEAFALRLLTSSTS